MKICIVAYKFGTEIEIGEHLGTYHYFIEILRELVKQGHEVYVMAPWLSFRQKGSLDVSGVKVIRYYPPLWQPTWAFPLNRLIRSWYIKATQSRVLSSIKKYRPKTVLVWQARETGYALAQIKDQLGVPLLFRQITTWQWHFSRPAAEVFDKRAWYNFFKKLKINYFIDQILEFLLDKKKQKKYAKLIYEKSDQVICISEVAASEAKQMGLDPKKIKILPVSIETDLFQPESQKLEKRKSLGLVAEKMILFIGRINFAEKGVGWLVEAMPRVVSVLSKAKLVIVGGNGEMERLKQLIDRLNLNKNVILVGQKPFSVLADYLKASDIFVMPSLWVETFGQVTIEAMACGLPVVTSDAGASPEINEHGQTGLVVKAGQTNDLSAALVKLLQDDALREKMGQVAREKVLANYTYESVVNKLLTIINDSRHE
jgi:glycosyltransferase involved in cell wall biosynthesis